MKTEPKLKKYWISWYHEQCFSPFEIDTAFWSTGWRVSDYAETICAAIYATSQTNAYDTIIKSYDEKPDIIDFRFCEKKPRNWTPYDERFYQASWMTFK